jgi:cytochrome c553
MQHVDTTSHRNIVLCASTIAAAILIAGAALTLTAGQTTAEPNKVTASKPCGSCHPPNNPPKRK